MSLRAVTQKWFAQRPEYRDEKSADDVVVESIMREVTIGDMQDSLRTQIRNEIRSIAKAEGKNAVKSMGRTVYVEVAKMDTLDGFLTEYLVPQFRRTGADNRRAWATTCDFCREHPELGLKPAEIWAMADGPSGDWEAA